MKSHVIVALLLFAASLPAGAGDKHAFSVRGLYSETCSCRPPCGCEMTGLTMGCLGVGALQISGGTYDGKDLAGLKAAYAVAPGDWVRLYVQAEPEKREAAEAFLRAVFSAWGKIESVKDAKIDIAEDKGNISVAVDDGKLMAYKTEAVLGADKQTPVMHSNVNDTLNHTFKQGLSVSCTYKDGDREITLEKGRNAYFNDAMDTNGEI
jgi:hypothetical protein